MYMYLVLGGLVKVVNSYERCSIDASLMVDATQDAVCRMQGVSEVSALLIIGVSLSEPHINSTA